MVFPNGDQRNETHVHGQKEIQQRIGDQSKRMNDGKKGDKNASKVPVPIWHSFNSDNVVIHPV